MGAAMKQAQAKTETSEARAADRYAIELATAMRELGAPDQPVRLHNISTQGFAGTTDHAFGRPCVVAITLPGVGDVKARVIWTGEGAVGGEFLAPLELDALDHPLGDLIRSGV